MKDGWTCLSIDDSRKLHPVHLRITIHSGRFEDEFIRERAKQLQEWVTRICNHPVVSRSHVWKHFLTCTDDKVIFRTF